MNKTTNFLALVLCVLALGNGCGGDDVANDKKITSRIEELTDADWHRIGGMKIYFGHHSVGLNILNGISDVMRQNHRSEITILATEDFSTISGGVLVHSGVGKNGDPLSKLQGFDRLVRNNLKSSADVAFFKFCYVDLNAKTDVDGLFLSYRNTLGELQKKFPETRFIHVTAPLTSNPTGFSALVQQTKSMIKGLMGRENTHPNVARSRFNEMMRNAYQGKEPLFDLAKVESTNINGKRTSLKRNGTTYHHLVPEYTDDGGHLNEMGRIRAAEELLLVLAKIR